MGTPQQDQWLHDVLNVVVDRAHDAADFVANAMPGGGAGQAPPSKNGNPHVTVIATPIVVHGKDAPPVVEIKKPINIVIDEKAKAQFRSMDQSEIDINERAARIVSTLHQDMHNRVGTWFRNEGIKTIDKMSDGPGDLTAGLASAFAGGITGVIGAAFPQVAWAMSALGSLEAAAQTKVSSDRRGEASDIKAQAKGFLNDIANEAERLVYQGRDEALKTIPALVDTLEQNPEDMQRLIDLSNDNVEFLATNRIANRWGTLADPGVLDRLEAKLHRVLTLRIKAAAKERKREELQGKLRNRYSTMTEGEAKYEMESWEAEYDIENGTLPEYQPIDTTRPN